MRGGQSEIITGPSMGRPGLKALLASLAILTGALIGALWSVTPAYAQSAGCNLANSGYFDRSGELNFTTVHPVPLHFVAGERFTQTIDVTFASGTNGHIDVVLHEGGSNFVRIVDDLIYFNSSTPMPLTSSIVVPETRQAKIEVSTFGSGGAQIHGERTFTCAPAAPVLTGLSASSGYTTGGEIVTITGTGFYSTTQVLMDGTAIPATHVSDTEIKVTMPARSRGTVNIGLRSGTVTSTTQTYTYRARGALSVTPDTGSDFDVVGRVGGSFSDSMVWTMTNPGDEPIDVDIRYLHGGDGPDFLTLSGAPFSTIFELPANESRAVTFSISANASTLPPADYSASIIFADLTNPPDSNTTTVRYASLLIARYFSVVTVTSSQNPSNAGDPVTFTATISDALSPTGTVEFRVDGSVLGVAPVVGGQASIDAPNLPAGDRAITAFYSGDANNSSRTSSVYHQQVERNVTTLSLISSANPSLAGDAVTFTATLAGGSAPTGDVELFSGADLLGTEPLTNGAAQFTTSALSVGNHQITAVYSGDANNAGSSSVALPQLVEAMPQVVFRVEADGDHGAFSFTSAEAGLNLSISTSGGVGQSAPVPLRPGSYGMTMGDRRADGLLLSAIACSDNDSVGDVDTRTLNIALSAAEALVCTFTVANTAQQTLQEIAAFLEARADVLLANMPHAQQRFARLKGQAPSVSSPGSALMSYLPVLVNGGTLSGSASLAQIEAMAGNEQQPRLDAWIDGTFGLYSNNGAQGRFGLVSLGADYLVNEGLLVGGFFQIDQLSQDNGVTGATAGGTGWMAGPYLTARLSDNLYFDFMAAGGQAENRVSPLGTYEDWYGSTRFLASATLQGEWSSGAWTFAPAASATWFSETSNAYTDSLGVAIPSTTIEQARFAAGPGVRHTQVLGGGITLSTNVRFEAVAGYRNSLVTPGKSNVHGRISGGLDFGFEGGAALAFSLSHDGLFGGGSRSTAANIRLSVPLH